MDEDEVGYVVVEFNQAGGSATLVSGELHWDRWDATDEADVQRQRTVSVGRCERYAVARVRLVEDAR